MREVVARLSALPDRLRSLRSPFGTIVWAGATPGFSTPEVLPELAGLAAIVVFVWLRRLGDSAGVAALVGPLLAAAGMWWFAGTLRTGRPARLWAGAAFGLSGLLPWAPWVVGLTWAAVAGRRRAFVALAAIAVALALSSGGPAAIPRVAAALALTSAAAAVAARRTGPTPSPRDSAFLSILILVLGAAGGSLGAGAVSPRFEGLRPWLAVAGVAVLACAYRALAGRIAREPRVRRVYVPDALAWLAARAAIAAISLAGVATLWIWWRSGGADAALAVPDLLRTYGAAWQLREVAPIRFAAALALCVASLIVCVGLIVDDVRRRRDRIESGAVYRQGVLRPDAPLEIPEGTPVRVTVEPADQGLAAWPRGEGEVPARLAPDGLADAPALPFPGAMRTFDAAASPPAARVVAGRTDLALVLFGLALAVYLLTRLWGIDRFPIYFFSDEATHAVFAQQLLDNGLKSGSGQFLPIYFEADGNRWTPLLSVYVHAVSVALFGKSVFVTRATGALMSLLGAAAVALILKTVFRARWWWIGALLMGLAPAWFLHSRTGFETVMMATFYACFLLCYLLYRTRSPRFLFAAILFGAATFYTYSNGQMVMAAAAALLLLTDIRYHLKHWRTALIGLLLVGVLAVPVLRFRTTQPESMTTHLRAIDSYWFHTMPLSQKLTKFADTYAYGLSPAYWFIPNDHDLVRHRMKAYGNLNTWLLPFFLLGAGICLWKVRSASHRAVLIAALAAPAGAALVDVTITRVMAFVGPASVISAIGIETAVGWLAKRGRARGGVEGAVQATEFPPTWAAGTVFTVLAALMVFMTRDALANGPRWYSDYGLYGMQYGAKQLFEDAIPELLAQNPAYRINMTPTWANGTDQFIRFFIPPAQQSRVQMLNVDWYMQERRPLDADTLLVMTPSEYQRASSSGKFDRVDVVKTVPYPDGSPGFYFASLTYAGNLEEVLAREHEERSRPVVGVVTVGGEDWQVTHSQLDMGEPKNLFDGDTFTLVRGLEANPIVFDFTFPTPRPLSALEADFASMDFVMTVKLYEDASGEPVTYTETYRGLPPDPHVEMAFNRGPAAVVRASIEVTQLNAGVEVHIHVRELKFK